MENLQVFIIAVLTALAAENVIFARGLGINKDTMFMKSVRSGILFGAVLTWMAFASSFFVVLINYLLEDNPYIRIIRPLAFVLGLVVVYILTVILAGVFLKEIAPQVYRIMPLAAFNSAVFGVFYISASQRFAFFQTVGYALGAGLGFTVGIFVIHFARKRLAISPVPRSFRGLPILLIYIGLISLAIYGLVGHDLPT